MLQVFYFVFACVKGPFCVRKLPFTTITRLLEGQEGQDECKHSKHKTPLSHTQNPGKLN